MSVLYDKLFLSEDYRHLSCFTYLSPLVDEIVSTFSGITTVYVDKDIDDFKLGSNALMPLGIIVNELITNAMKYAFKDRKECVLAIRGKMNNGWASIVVADNGIGFSDADSTKQSNGFGLSLVRDLVKQLEGNIEMVHDNGTRFTIGFPVRQ